jgi:hypothetical protein
VFQTESLSDVIPLTANEKALKAQFETVVRNGFDAFLQVAEALCEIRRRRLFRETYVTFADYVRGEFAMALPTANQWIRNFELAENLIADGIKLPADIQPNALKPLAGLPDQEGLRSVCWQFAANLCPARPPSSTLVSRLVRLVRNELDADSQLGDAHSNEVDSANFSSSSSPSPSSSLSAARFPGPASRRLTNPPARERPFLAPATRLATFPSFNPHLIVAQINGPDQAATAYRICDELVDRLHVLQETLKTSFPEVVPS